MPEAWAEAIEELTDEQIAHGLKTVMRESPIHPPPLGQFVQACMNMPIAQASQLPNLQSQLCEYAAIKFHGRLKRWEYSRPWTYLYREWFDGSRPKGMEKCAECTGVLIECENGTAFRITVAEMQADTEGYQRMLRNFRPGPLPARHPTEGEPHAQA
jgi:hypothetical protein